MLKVSTNKEFHTTEIIIQQNERIVRYIISALIEEITKETKSQVFGGNPVIKRTGTTQRSITSWNYNNGYKIGSQSQSRLPPWRTWMPKLQRKYNYLDRIGRIVESISTERRIDMLIAEAVEKVQ